MRQICQYSVLSCFIAVLVTGCYTYAPIQSPQPGMEVRAQLNTEAAVRRSQGFDDPILRYDGIVVDVTSDALSLDVLIARSTNAIQDIVIRDTVMLQMTEVQSLMQRKISPAKSALVTVGVGAAAVAVVLGIDAVVGGTGGPDDNGTPTTLRIPVFSWVGLRLVPSFIGFAPPTRR